jgi:phage-related protein
VIEHTSSGAQLIFSTSLALGAGEFLLIDMEKKTVLANGQASRNTFITSRGWSGFDPGPNTWSLNAASFNASARLTVMANPSWE